MKKILIFIFYFVILNITGCDKKANISEVKPSKEESVKISKYENIYNKCMNTAQTVNNSTVSGCSGEAQDAADKDMNILLNKIYVKLKDDEYKADALKEYQAAWEVYADAEADFDSATIGSPQRGITRYTLTGQRVEFLNNYEKELK